MILERPTNIYIRGDIECNILGENIVSTIGFYIGLQFGCGGQYVRYTRFSLADSYFNC